jgi:hypothetical protein
MAKNTMKNLKRKMRQRAKKLAAKAVTTGVHQVGARLGIDPQMQSMIDKAVDRGVAKGMGAYGRGAYGRGSYVNTNEPTPKVNSLFLEYPERRMKASHLGDETGRVCVKRREYVMRVTSPASPGSFSNTSFSINPGQSGVFAWLSQVAVNYDEYSLKHLVFEYKPVISQASQSGTMGSVLLAANYNAGAVKFSSFREMAEYEGSLETRICDRALFGVECDAKKHSSQDVEFVRAGTVPEGEDIKTYDLATFQIATSDIDPGDYPAGTLLGHLYVEYEVQLGKPKLFSALGKAILCDFYRGTVGIANGLPWGTAPIANPANTMGITLNSGSFTFPDNFYGRVLVIYYLVADTPKLAHSVNGNITAVPILGWNGTDSSEKIDATTTAGALQGYLQLLVDVAPASTPGGNLITVSPSGLGTAYGFTLEVTQSNPLISTW